MKKLIAVFSVMALAAVAALALAGEPKIHFDKADHDFGVIDKGDKVSVEFAFTNKGEGDLEIKNVATSCGCTTAKPEKAVYKPGETGVIPVTFDSTRFSGAIVKNITVYSNDPANERMQLKITGDVQAEINMKPASLAIVGLKRGDEATREIEVSSAKLGKLEVSGLETDIPGMTLAAERKDDQTVVIKASYNSANAGDSNTLRGAISFRTNSEKQPDVRVSAFVNIDPPVKAMPRSVNFFASKKGQSRDMTVRLQASEGEDLKILEAGSDLSFIAVAPDGGGLKVTLTDSAKEGRFNGFITVKTNVKEQPELKIPVRGSVL